MSRRRSSKRLSQPCKRCLVPRAILDSRGPRAPLVPRAIRARLAPLVRLGKLVPPAQLAASALSVLPVPKVTLARLGRRETPVLPALVGARAM